MEEKKTNLTVEWNAHVRLLKQSWNRFKSRLHRTPKTIRLILKSKGQRNIKSYCNNPYHVLPPFFSGRQKELLPHALFARSLHFPREIIYFLLIKYTKRQNQSSDFRRKRNSGPTSDQSNRSCLTRTQRRIFHRWVPWSSYYYGQTSFWFWFSVYWNFVMQLYTSRWFGTILLSVRLLSNLGLSGKPKWADSNQNKKWIETIYMLLF